MTGCKIAFRVVLLDIEGTVTPISYVYEKLFPYARAHGPQFIREHWDEEILRDARANLLKLNESDQAEGAPMLTGSDTAVNYYLWLMDRDRKVSALKTIQGLVWEHGFQTGELQSEIFADVPAALNGWQRAGKKIAIYSSGSVLAQQNVFRHSNYGDLTQFIDAYFDTQVGNKREPASYKTIARCLKRSPRDLLFLSDSLDELNSAAIAGVQTAMCARPGNAPVTVEHAHWIIQTFEDVSGI